MLNANPWIDAVEFVAALFGAGIVFLIVAFALLLVVNLQHPMRGPKS